MNEAALADPDAMTNRYIGQQPALVADNGMSANDGARPYRYAFAQYSALFNDGARPHMTRARDRGIGVHDGLFMHAGLQHRLGAKVPSDSCVDGIGIVVDQRRDSAIAGVRGG